MRPLPSPKGWTQVKSSTNSIDTSRRVDPPAESPSRSAAHRRPTASGVATAGTGRNLT